MQLMPKRIKFRKSHRGKRKGEAQRGNTVAFGEFGLMALEDCWLAARQIEAGRVAASHHMGKEGKLYIRVFPHKPISAKPAETRMGKGKGEPEYYAAVIKPGAVLYEVGGVNEALAREALNLIAHKMPIRCKMVLRRHGL
ncbi:MAG: 50S ribosomal protein L16 [Planctomycetes bacterium]|nr:50S ribosomal protein L16 [Planctomycetota bacterium]